MLCTTLLCVPTITRHLNQLGKLIESLQKSIAANVHSVRSVRVTSSPGCCGAGTELYPRIGKHFDIKTWTNCRMGMMAWTFINVCFAFKQRSLNGSISNSMLVSIILSGPPLPGNAAQATAGCWVDSICGHCSAPHHPRQRAWTRTLSNYCHRWHVLAGVYCLKFFIWETGYWRTMDIAHDRAGYYLCWGCLNWVTCIYTSQALFLTRHPNALSPAAAIAILVAGLAMIYINWEADDQRMRFRESGGEELVWGRKPKFITAKYTAGALSLHSATTCLLHSTTTCLVVLGTPSLPPSL